MALSKFVKFENSGIELPEAYIRISDFIDCRKIKNPHISIQVEIFVSEDARNNGKDPFMTMNVFTCSLQDNPEDYEKFFVLDKLEKSGENQVKSSYKWLKTLPYFIDSKDRQIDKIVIKINENVIDEKIVSPDSILTIEE